MTRSQRSPLSVWKTSILRATYLSLRLHRIFFLKRHSTALKNLTKAMKLSCLIPKLFKRSTCELRPQHWSKTRSRETTLSKVSSVAEK